MRNSALVLCLCLFALWPQSSFAQAGAPHETAHDSAFGKIPPILFEGLHQLADQKPEEAEKTWFRGSPFAEQHISGELRALLTNNGKFENFDVVNVQDITPRLRILHLALNFETQPIIVKFVIYRTTDGWILLSRKIGISEEFFESIAPPAQN